MEEDLREQARERYTRRCGYCGVTENRVGATLTIDHHRPRARGGGDEDGNIVYCCTRCNEHKGSYWHETDPPHIPLLHPLRDALSLHLWELDDGQLEGLTPQGSFFIQRLRLNRPQLIAYRLRRRAERTRRERLQVMDQHVEALRQRIAELHELFEVIDDEIERESG